MPFLQCRYHNLIDGGPKTLQDDGFDDVALCVDGDFDNNITLGAAPNLWRQNRIGRGNRRGQLLHGGQQRGRLGDQRRGPARRLSARTRRPPRPSWRTIV